MKKNVVEILIICILTCAFCGCVEKKYSETFYAMDTVMTVTVYGSSAKTAVGKAYDEIQRLEKLLSATDKNSEIYALNHRKTDTVSSETAYLIQKAVDISREGYVPDFV